MKAHICHSFVYTAERYYFLGTLSLFQMGLVYVSVFTVSIGLTKDRERSKTVACARYLTLQ